MTSRQIALVTGASRGLGRSTALALAHRGVRVVVTYREDAQGADDTVRVITGAGGDALAMPLDIGDVDSFAAFGAELVEQLRARWNTENLDILVNNAGIGIFAPLAEVTTATFDAVVNTNFRGTFFLVQALVPHIPAGGRIINVSTSLTRHASPGTSVYSASKAALEVLTRSLAIELGARGIRINAVAPGPSATDFNGGAMRDAPELRNNLAAQTALGRVGEPDEIGDAIAALASDDMRWVTAERIEVSGGSLI
ncbi:SDR family NAD(P)-dependent oxidoreductase [Rhodococcus opacus]|uniref:3-oxoacyl-ACP reductase n=1 Tax=Rhodococcus opacus TaxID=37919 RepID=A0A076ET29_RHOOP|nr:SDR family oxidoreductase [Rhodococcus opacus]AII08298.1 3-oxoacyl-ACP reductase [Rhodococcus opacus]